MIEQEEFKELKNQVSILKELVEKLSKRVQDLEMHHSINKKLHHPYSPKKFKQ